MHLKELTLSMHLPLKQGFDSQSLMLISQLRPVKPSGQKQL